MEEMAKQDSSSAAGIDLGKLVELVEELQKSAQELLQESGGIQALERNARRILASVRMLQLNLGLDPSWPKLLGGSD